MTYIKLAQFTIAILLILVILLQNRGAGLSGVFGGAGNVYLTKRGLEKKLFNLTIVLLVMFFATSMLAVFYN